jgi:hypothetical protein
VKSLQVVLFNVASRLVICYTSWFCLLPFSILFV